MLKYGVALLGLVLGYGKMQSDVGHLNTDVGEIKRQVNVMYEHLAWDEKGSVGPAPPVVRKEAQ